MTGPGGVSERATTGPGGAAVFTPVVAGRWDLTVLPRRGFELPAGHPTPHPIEVVAGSTTEVRVPVLIEGGRSAIVGRASYLESGVGSVTIRAAGPGGETREAVTPNSGDFSLDDLDPGVWSFEATPPAYFRIRSQQPAGGPIELAPGGVARVDVFLGPPRDPGTRIVTIDAERFVPQRLAVLPGTWVLWVNESGGRHSITPLAHAEWSAAVLAAPGETFGAVLNNPGTYEFFSEFGSGPAGSMSGLIEVDRP